MTFEIDALAQVGAINANLVGCSQTLDPERAALTADIDSVITGVAVAAFQLEHVHSIKSQVFNRALSEEWFFLGTAFGGGRSRFYNTRRADQARQGYAFGLRAIDDDLSPSDAFDVASELLAELSSTSSFVSGKSSMPELPLHRHGTPMWLAVPESEVALSDDDLSLLPARLGLDPTESVQARYIFIEVSAEECFVPRFADSGAYPYWKPGGKTAPIETCPAGLTGFTEVVGNGLTLSNLSSPFRQYLRKI